MTDMLHAQGSGGRAHSIEPIVIGASGLVGGAFYKSLCGAGYLVHGTYLTRPAPGLQRHDLKD